MRTAASPRNRRLDSLLQHRASTFPPGLPITPRIHPVPTRPVSGLTGSTPGWHCMIRCRTPRRSGCTGSSWRGPARLFARFDGLLRAKGWLAMGGQIVDATVIQARCFRPDRTDRAQQDRHRDATAMLSGELKRRLRPTRNSGDRNPGRADSRRPRRENRLRAPCPSRPR
jgi:hypothetical protein